MFGMNITELVCVCKKWVPRPCMPEESGEGRGIPRGGDRSVGGG
jgi:hypothetical protein